MSLRPLRLHRIDDHDAVVALADGVAGMANAGRVVAVIAHHRQIGGLHHGRAALRAAQDADRAVADGSGRRRVAREVVADMFVAVRDDAVVAVLAAADVDDQVPLAHRLPPTPRGAILKASAFRHFSICTRQELGAMLLVPRVCDRSGVSMFRQPPISTVSPATSMSWNSALAS